MGELMLNFFVAFIASIGFSIMFNLPRRLLLYTGFTGAIGFLTYKIASMYRDDFIVPALCGSVIVGVVGQLFASICKHPSTLFTIPGIIPLVPGYPLYKSMLYLVQKDYDTAGINAIESMLVAISIACGIAISSSFMLKFKPKFEKILKYSTGRKNKL